jgi:hypothetical protein
MQKRLYYKTLAIGIILLFLGVSVSSAISIDTKSTITNIQSEECKECNEVSKSDLVIVERLLNRVEVYSKLLLVLSNNNPEIREKCEELSNIKDTIDWDFPIICNILGSIAFKLEDIADLIWEWVISTEYDTLEFWIRYYCYATIFGVILGPIVYSLVEIGRLLECDWI